MTLDLHGHIPFESHEREADPWTLQLQAREYKYVFKKLPKNSIRTAIFH